MLIPELNIYLPDHEIAAELFAGSSGPGGQNVNKVATAVRLRLPVASCSLPEHVKSRIFSQLSSRLDAMGNLVVESRVHRTQAMNRAEAMEKLTVLLKNALRPRRRRIKTKPTAGAVCRRLEAKSRQAERKSGRTKPRSED